jgi:hypothetical protein
MVRQYMHKDAPKKIMAENWIGKLPGYVGRLNTAKIETEKFGIKYLSGQIIQ